MSAELQLEQLVEQIKWNEAGLVPAIVQDASSKEVLMLAYMNEQSLCKSVETGETWFWSRSRQELWHKGATSGHIQQIQSLKLDCDGDTLLVNVHQQGPACHTGSQSCFYRGVELRQSQQRSLFISEEQTSPVTINQLEALIDQRYRERPEGSYTTYLFEKGLDKILKKIGEEASEVIIAAKNENNDELRLEVSDLLFHLLVLLRERGQSYEMVLQELSERHGKPTTNKMR